MSKSISSEYTFPRAFVEYFASLSSNIFDIFAGITATLILAYTVKIPWIIILLPMMLTLRGDLSGVFTGVLTTSLHVGEINPKFFNNTDNYYALASAIFFLSFSNGILAGFFVYLYELFSSRTCFLEILYISLNTFQLAAFASLLITSLTAFTVARYGLDPDVYVYPIVSVINDVLVGLMIVVSIEILQPWNKTYFLLTGTMLFIFFVVINVHNIKRFFSHYRFKKTIKEAYFAVLLGLIFSFANGIVLSNSLDLLNFFPEILVVYPAFIAALGSQGVIVTSQLTTELRFGTIRPNITLLWDKELWRRIIAVIFASLALYIILGGIAIFVTARFNLVVFTKLIVIFSIAGLSTYVFVLFPSSVIFSVFMYKKGFDPDNLMISLLTTISDFIGVNALIHFGYLILI
ncbi:MAG: magnesium transporter [Candidatus Njordarchaeia archaeon]